MEDVYTLKVKTKPDTRNLYPSERRYSASTVSGLAWIHIVLAITLLILSSLALVNPNLQVDNSTKIDNVRHSFSYIIVLAPTFLSFFALIAGLTAILASVRWYIDRNIAIFFIVSILSSIISLLTFITIAVLISTPDNETDLVIKDVFVFKQTDILHSNVSHIIIARNTTDAQKDDSNLTKHYIAINILIAAFLELLWSLLSVKISFKGMRNNYKDENDRPGNCIQIVTTVKGNNTKKIPRHGKLLPLTANLTDQYSNRKMKKIFLAQGDNGFYLKNENNKIRNTDTSSEFYKERMLSFLNRCTLEGISNTESPSVTSDQNRVQEIANDISPVKEKNPETPVSWDDSVQSVCNQNTLNLDKIYFSLCKNTKIES